MKMREEILSIYSAYHLVTMETKVKGLRYFCGCEKMSLIRNFFERRKAIPLCCLPLTCPEHGKGIESLLGRKRGT